MKVLKKSFMILLSALVMIIFSGCQKDEITSKTKEVAKTEESTEIPASAQKEEDATKEENKAENIDKSTKEEKVTEKEESKQEKETTTPKENSKVTSQKSKQQQSKSTAAETKSSKVESNKTETKTNTSNQNHANEESKSSPKQSVPQSTVTLSIVGDKQKGTILSSTKVSIAKGDTVLDVTRKILKEKKKQIDVRGSGGSAYVEGIDNLYEFDHGPLSGWTVKKNGVLLDRSVGAKSVNDGDIIQWIYTTDYTKDSE